MTTDEMFDVLLETLGAEDFLNELVKALNSDEQRENFEFIARMQGIELDDSESED
ncbi:hypothetical protein [Bifidobacterium pseudocatenulatum]|jgi:hypothetical protein|uniref:hypothetical protein n=1 Tax=Bifidobacterium pseudocatenulatum TaxID=28026 RepID=UPI0035647739